jgi:hypothetical protein
MIPLTAFSAFCKLFFFGVLQDSKINTYAKMWAYMDQNRQATSHVGIDNALLVLYHVHFTTHTQCRIRTFYKKSNNLPVVAVLN